nr:MAG TPA: hypothetical protein [Caudoviricetes sp.]
MKTILQALRDEIHYPIPVGFIENKLIARQLRAEDPYNHEVSECCMWKGALADCLYSLLQAVSYSESDKSVGTLSDKDKERLLVRVNALYESIGEPTVGIGLPTVTFGE